MSISDSGQGEFPDVERVNRGKTLRTAVVFVRVVPTVVVIVALPASWYTAVVVASELVWLTCPLSCSNHYKMLR